MLAKRLVKKKQSVTLEPTVSLQGFVTRRQAEPPEQIGTLAASQTRESDRPQELR